MMQKICRIFNSSIPIYYSVLVSLGIGFISIHTHILFKYIFCIPFLFIAKVYQGYITNIFCKFLLHYKKTYIVPYTKGPYISIEYICENISLPQNVFPATKIYAHLYMEQHLQEMKQDKPSET